MNEPKAYKDNINETQNCQPDQYNEDLIIKNIGAIKERIRQLRDKSLKKLRNESYTLLKYIQ